jgi:hypothetical protein
MQYLSTDPTSDYYNISRDSAKQQEIKDNIKSLLVFDKTMKEV